MPRLDTTRNLRGIVVCLVVLAVLLSAVAAWKRFVNRPETPNQEKQGDRDREVDADLAEDEQF